MGIEETRNGKLLYHLTRLDNLDSILKHGLVPRKAVIDYNLYFLDVANQEIISKRTELGLDIYTPFHFHPYSSFDVAVKNTYFNENFIYICISRDDAMHNNFKILPRHPLNMEECELMDYKDGFDAIDWDTMQCKGRDDDYAKKVKMAECLTEFIIPPTIFQCIYVKDEETKLLVEKSLKEYDITKKPPYVDVSKWL